MTAAEIGRAIEFYGESKSLVCAGNLLGFDHGTIHLPLHFFRRT